MADLGQLTLNLNADTTQLNLDLLVAEAQANRSAQMIGGIFRKALAVKVDDTALTRLNEHLDLKRQHLTEVIQHFNANPLRPKVDLSDLRVGLIQTEAEINASNNKLKNLSSQLLRVKVDDTALTKLNQHLDRKQRHLSETVHFYQANPIVPRASTSGLTKVEKSLDRIRRNTNVDVNVTQKKRGLGFKQAVRAGGNIILNSLHPTNNLHSSIENNITNAITRGFNRASRKKPLDALFKGTFNLAGSLFKTAIAPIGFPLKSVARGIFNGLGEGLSKDLSSGVNTALDLIISSHVGSFRLLGKTITEGFIEGGGGLAAHIGKIFNVEQLFNEHLEKNQHLKEIVEAIKKQGVGPTIGMDPEEILIEGKSLSAKERKRRQARTPEAREQLEIEERFLEQQTAKGRQQVQVISSGLQGRQIDLTKRLKSINPRITELQATKDRLIELRQDPNNAHKSERLFGLQQKVQARIEKLASKSESSSGALLNTVESKLKNEAALKELEEKSRVTKKALAIVGRTPKPQEKPRRYVPPQNYKTIVESALSAASYTGEYKIPQLVVATDAEEEREAAYNPKNNTIKVPQHLHGRIINNQLTEEDVGVLLHEARHAMQFNFGKSNPYVETPGVNLQSLTPEQQKTQIPNQVEASVLAQANPNLKATTRRLEEDAYGFQYIHQKSTHGQVLAQGLTSQFGAGGVFLKNAAEKPLNSLESLHGLIGNGKIFPTKARTTYKVAVAQVTSMMKSRSAFLAKFAEINNLSTEEIEEVRVAGQEIVAMITQANATIDKLKLDIIQTHKQAKKKKDILTEPVPGPKGFPGETTLPSKNSEAEITRRVAKQRIKAATKLGEQASQYIKYGDLESAKELSRRSQSRIAQASQLLDTAKEQGLEPRLVRGLRNHISSTRKKVKKNLTYWLGAEPVAEKPEALVGEVLPEESPIATAADKYQKTKQEQVPRVLQRSSFSAKRNIVKLLLSRKKASADGSSTSGFINFGLIFDGIGESINRARQSAGNSVGLLLDKIGQRVTLGRAAIDAKLSPVVGALKPLPRGRRRNNPYVIMPEFEAENELNQMLGRRPNRRLPRSHLSYREIPDNVTIEDNASFTHIPTISGTTKGLRRGLGVAVGVAKRVLNLPTEAFNSYTARARQETIALLPLATNKVVELDAIAKSPENNLHPEDSANLLVQTAHARSAILRLQKLITKKKLNGREVQLIAALNKEVSGFIQSFGGQIPEEFNEVNEAVQNLQLNFVRAADLGKLFAKGIAVFHGLRAATYFLEPIFRFGQQAVREFTQNQVLENAVRLSNSGSGQGTKNLKFVNDLNSRLGTNSLTTLESYRQFTNATVGTPYEGNAGNQLFGAFQLSRRCNRATRGADPARASGIG